MAELTFTPVIGIEIHIQLKTASKVFCKCSTDTSAEPNTNVCPVCMGLPGSLPRLNREVVEQGMRAGFALHGSVNLKSFFFRKSYFYPDLPKGYQITQSDLPIIQDGYIEVHDSANPGQMKKIRVNRLHLEEDVGRLHHSAADGRLEGATTSYVDYNRSGLALAEIVSEPDVSSSAEAVEYAMTLRRRVRYTGASDVDLEKGMMRFDANVSMKCSDGRWGNKVEVKNMNSFKALERAIEYEIRRQKNIMLKGGEILQETRHWNDAKGSTTGSRVKEFYRKFIVEPDLPPLIITQEWADKIASEMPEMPDAKAARYVKDWGIPQEVADMLTDSRDLAEYFEACVAASGANGNGNPVRTAHWVRTEVLRVMNDKGMSLAELTNDESGRMTSKILSDIVNRVETGRLSTTQARSVFDRIIETGESIDDAAKACGVTEGGVAGDALMDTIKAIIAANQDVVAEIKSGKDTKGKKMKFLQGLVMKETKGQAKPAELPALIAKALE